MVRLTYRIGAYTSKAKNLEEFARINYNVDCESVFEDVFYNKEQGFTIIEIRQVIAISAYVMLYHTRDGDI